VYWENCCVYWANCCVYWPSCCTFFEPFFVSLLRKLP
jgi:hypothetical protein